MLYTCAPNVYASSDIIRCSSPALDSVQAAQRVPTVGHIVGTLWELRDLVAVAKGNRANCNTLAAFSADIMRAFDFQGDGSSL